MQILTLTLFQACCISKFASLLFIIIILIITIGAIGIEGLRGSRNLLATVAIHHVAGHPVNDFNVSANGDNGETIWLLLGPQGRF